MSRLLHYSAEAISAVEDRDQRAGRARDRADKPNGLWVSVEGENDWRSWCEAESFDNLAAKLCYEVTLAPGAKILRITTEGALRRFSHTYGYERYARLASYPDYANVDGIAWDHIGATYDGIIIAPYQWGCRLDHAVSWYYGWDCASGCIWNARAVASLSLVQSDREVRV